MLELEIFLRSYYIGILLDFKVYSVYSLFKG